MSLVPSLLQAIVQVDGDALVMHAGDKPYVVSPTGQVDLATRGLTLGAVNGILAQLLTTELQQALDEFGAVQHDLPFAPEFPGEQFTVVAARGGDDVWVEIRRRKVPDDDQIPEEFFPSRDAVGDAQPYPVYAAAASPRLGVPSEPIPDSLELHDTPVTPGAAVLRGPVPFPTPSAAAHVPTAPGYAPAAPKPAPGALRPAPVAPEPVLAAPAPVPVAPEPVLAAPEPVLAAPEPVSAAPEPVPAAPEPAAPFVHPWLDLSRPPVTPASGISEAAPSAPEPPPAASLPQPSFDAPTVFEPSPVAFQPPPPSPWIDIVGAIGGPPFVETDEWTPAEAVAEYEPMPSDFERAYIEPEVMEPYVAEAARSSGLAATELIAREEVVAPAAASQEEAAPELVPYAQVASPEPIAEPAVPEPGAEAVPHEPVVVEQPAVPDSVTAELWAAALEPFAVELAPSAPEPFAAEVETSVSEPLVVEEPAAPEPVAADLPTEAPEPLIVEAVTPPEPLAVEAAAAPESVVEEPAAPEVFTAEPAVTAPELFTADLETPALEHIAWDETAAYEPVAAEFPEAIVTEAAAPELTAAELTATEFAEVGAGDIGEATAELISASFTEAAPEAPVVEDETFEAPAAYEEPASGEVAPNEPVFVPAPFQEPAFAEIASAAEAPQAVDEAPPAVDEAPQPEETELMAEIGELQAEIEPERPSRQPIYSAPRVATTRDAFAPPQPAIVLPLARNPIRADQPAAPPPADHVSSGLDRLLRLSAARGASTLYLASASRPSVRVDGEMQMLEGEPVLTSRDVESLLLTLMPERSHEALRTGAATEWICDIEDVGRVRCMSFRDHRGPGGVFRLMPTRSVSADQLALPKTVQALAIEPEGLVLVAGPRSSGKRTLLSAFVDLINHSRRDHVITVEREVNIVHERGTAFVSQREIRGSDEDVVTAARAALREDPDVLVIEDLRTAALTNVALEAAASGHLVIGGFSAHSVTGAIDRIIDLYAPEHRRQVQFALADNLRGVVAQVLLRKTGGGRVAAREVLLNTPAVSSVIAEGKTSQLPLAIEGGRRGGMVPLNDALVSLVQQGVVDGREAYRYASDRAGLLATLKREGVDTSFVERLA